MPAPGRHCAGCDAPCSGAKYTGFYVCDECRVMIRQVMARAAEVLNRPPPARPPGSPGVFLFPTTAVGVPR